MAVCGAHGLADRFAGKEIVAEVDGIELGIFHSMGFLASAASRDFAILFSAAVLGRDEFRRQLDHSVVAQRNEVAETSVWRYSCWPPTRALVEQWGAVDPGQPELFGSTESAQRKAAELTKAQ
jgi:hypothetical protein